MARQVLSVSPDYKVAPHLQEEIDARANCGEGFAGHPSVVYPCEMEVVIAAKTVWKMLVGQTITFSLHSFLFDQGRRGG